MLDDSELIERFTETFAATFKQADTALNSPRGGTAFAQRCVARQKDKETQARGYCEPSERELNKVLQAAAAALTNVRDVRTELKDSVLKCDLPIGCVYELRLRRVGFHFFAELSMENGLSVQCLPVGPADAALGNIHVYQVERGGLVRSVCDGGKEDYRRQALESAAETFLRELACQLPTYRAAFRE